MTSSLFSLNIGKENQRDKILKVYFDTERVVGEHLFFKGSWTNANLCKVYERHGDKEEDFELLTYG